MSERVTVILTVYKRTEYLPEALNSALEQTWPDCEIIVVDDSGFAAARDICAPHIQSGKITYIANRENIGIVGSILKAVSQSSGQYVAILNDDDAWEPGFLAGVIPPMVADKNCVLCFSDHWIMDEHSVVDPEQTEANTQQYHRHNKPEGKVADAATFTLVHNGVPLAMASAFRKDAIDWKRLTNDVAGAYDFWISCLLTATGKAIHYVPQRLTRYRVHSQMETGRRSPDKNDNLVYIFSQLLTLNAFPEHQRYLRAQLASALFLTGKDRLYFGMRRPARERFFAALGQRFSLKPIAGVILTGLPLGLLRALKLATPENGHDKPKATVDTTP
ncbi:glycosyltransferase family 2 protein [Cerasicoccus fimbriatus]|uniref:glycosyltransferase family 2 protein n=1 Tax=Cerasicoccus fimbriatus TaxID=3014554 RepID=UPI0022B37261|nr:glycosyltransferase family 2 protein [Cerasicoccus sp. TK19100]